MNIQGALAAGYTMEEINAEMQAIQQEQSQKQSLLAPAMAAQPAMEQQFIQTEGANTPWEKLKAGVIENQRKVFEYDKKALPLVGGLLAAGATGGASLIPQVLGTSIGYAAPKGILDIMEGNQTTPIRDLATGAMFGMGAEMLAPAAGLLYQGGKAALGKMAGIPRTMGDLAEVAGMPRPPLTGITGGGMPLGRGAAPGSPGGGQRVMAGYMDPVEASSAGIPMSAGDIRMLSATTPEEMALAMRMKTGEALRATDKLSAIGGKLTDIEAGKMTWGTDFLKKQLGITGNEALTPATVGRIFKRLGGEFDAFADEVGAVRYSPQVADDLKSIMAETEGGHASQIAGYVKRMEEAALANGGVITPKVWSSIRHDLGKTMKAAGGQGNFAKLHDAGAVQGVLDDMLHASASPELQQSIAQTRRQYGILKTALSRDSGINAAGEVNPATFFNAYMKKSPSRYMNFENDPVAKAFGTLNVLSRKVLPSSGTAERLLANPVRAGITGAKAMTPIAMGLLGYKALKD